MVSTKSNPKGGGPRDKGSQQKTHVKSPTIPVPTDPPAGKKATAEQIRMNNMIFSDSTDMDNDKIKGQVQQIKELTNRSEDEILVVLYDANYDTEQAINMLLERDESQNKSSDGWVTTSSKKSKLKGQQQGGGRDSLDIDFGPGRRPDRERSRGGGRDRDKNDMDGGRDNRSDGRDFDRRRDGGGGGGYRGRGRGGRGQLPPRMTRGKGRDYDRGGRNDNYRGDRDRDYGRGRGRRDGEMNGPSRNSRGGGSPRSFTNSNFNDSSSKPVENDAFSTGDNVWRNPPEENWDDVDSSAPKEDWGAEEWTGDLTVSQVFSASTTDDLTGNAMDQVVQPPPASALSTTTQPPYTSVGGSVGTYGGGEPFQSTSIYGQNNPPAAPIPQQNTGMPAMTTRSIDLNELFRSSGSQLPPSQSALPGVTTKEDTNIFSQFQQAYQSSATLPEPPKPSSQLNDVSIQGPPSSLGRAPQMSSSQPTHQPRVPTAQPVAQSKPARKKLPPSNSKFPPSAVEMPLSSRGLGGLDVRFGAMDLNMDPAITDYGVILPGTSLSKNNGDLSSGAFSVNDTKSSATSHLSSYKVPDSVYSTDLGGPRMASSSSSIPPSAPSGAMSSYGHGQTVPSPKLAPEPIPLPQSSSYLQSASNGPVENAAMTSTMLPSSGMSTNVLAPSSSFSLSANQGMSTSRQAGSYGTPSSAMTVTVSSSISSYGAPAMSGTGGLGAPGTLSGSGSLGPAGAPGMGGHGGLGGAGTLGGSGGLGSGGLSGPSGALGGALGATGSLGVSSSMGPTSGGTIGTNTMGGPAGHPMTGPPSNSIGGGPTSIGSATNSGAATNSMGYPSTSGALNSQLPSSSPSPAAVNYQTTTSSSQSAHTSVQTSPLPNSGGGGGKMGSLDGRAVQHGHDGSSLGSSASATGTSPISGSTVTPSPSVSATAPASSVSATSSTGYSTATCLSTAASVSGSITSSGIKPSSGKVPPNLPPGMPFVNPHLIMGGHGLLPVNAYAHQFYNIDDMMLQRMQQTPIGYPYDLQQFQQLATTLNTGRDPAALSSTAQYSVTEAGKFPRNDAASPVASSLSSQQQQAGGHHQTQAQTQTPFLNPTLPPGYPAAGYGGLPYGGLTYPAQGILPPGLTYPMFPTVSSVQPPSRTQAGTTPHSAYQQSAFGQPATYGTNTAMKRGYQPFGHPGPQPNPPGAFGTLQGYDDPADFSKGFSSQSQSKGSAASARGGVSVSSASDVGGSYGSKSHSQTFADKQGAYHNQTPPPFSFPMAAAGATQAGHAGATYPAPFVPLFPPQAHSAMPLHQIPGDTTAGAAGSQRPQGTSGQNKGPAGKGGYGAYWGN